MCMLKNADGTNKVISGNENNKCMWKYPTDVPNRVKTRLKAKNEPPVGYKEVDKYFATKYFIPGWVVGKEGRFFCAIKFFLEYTMLKYIYKRCIYV